MNTRREGVIHAAHGRTCSRADSLPVELLALIFGFLIIETTPSPEHADLRHPVVLPWLSQVMHCCSLWRQIALSTPSLWTSIPITRSRHCQKRRQFMVKHSNPLMLDIVAYDMGYTNIGRSKWPLGWITREAGRIKLLHVPGHLFNSATPAVAQTLAVSWQALRTLIVSRTGSQTVEGDDALAALLVAALSSSPLNHLDLQELPVVGLALVRETLTSLVLHVTHWSPHDIVPSIRMLSHLQSISLRCHFIREEYNALPSSLNLPYLNSLRLIADEGSCAAFLRMLRIQKVVDVKTTFHLCVHTTHDGEDNTAPLITAITSFLDSWLPDAPAMDERQIEYTYGLEDSEKRRDPHLSIALTSSFTDVQLFFTERNFYGLAYATDILGCVANRGARHAIFSAKTLPKPAWSELFWHEAFQSISQSEMKSLHFDIQHPNSAISLHPLLRVLCAGDTLSRLDTLTFEADTFPEEDLALLKEALGISSRPRGLEKNSRKVEFRVIK